MISIRSAAPLALLALAATALADPVKYRIVKLDNLAGDKAGIAYGINDLGQVVGNSYSSAGASSSKSRATIWDQNGHATSIGGLGTDTASMAVGINNAGQIAANSLNLTDGYRAFRSSGGVNSALGSVAGLGQAFATGINSSGAMSGYAQRKDFESALMWNAGSTTATEIGSQSGVLRSWGRAIDDAGHVVGDDTLSDPSGAFGPQPTSWIWSGGVNYTNLALPTDAAKYYATATSPNGQYQIGTAITADDWYYGTVSNGGTSTAFSDFLAFPKGVNDKGQIVGDDSYLRQEFLGSGTAYLYENGSVFDLTSLIDTSLTADAWQLNSATAINANGWIVGGGTVGGKSYGYLAIPVQAVPEPGTFVALGLGGLALFRRRRR